MPGNDFWRSKPPAGAELDRSHPLAKGLVVALALNEGSGASALNLCDGQSATFGSGAAYGGSAIGPVVTFDNTTNGSVTTAVSEAYYVPPPVSIACWLNVTSLAANLGYFGYDVGTIYRGYFGVVLTNGAIDVQYGDGGGTASSDRRTFRSGSGAVVANVGAHYAGVIRGPTDGALYKNGQPLTVSTSGTGDPPAFARTGLTIGQSSNSGAPLTLPGSIGYFYVWTRALTQDEAAAIAANPYQLFAPPVWRRYFVVPDGAPAANLRRYSLTLTGVG